MYYFVSVEECIKNAKLQKKKLVFCRDYAQGHLFDKTLMSEYGRQNPVMTNVCSDEVC